MRLCIVTDDPEVEPGVDICGFGFEKGGQLTPGIGLGNVFCGGEGGLVLWLPGIIGGLAYHVPLFVGREVEYLGRTKIARVTLEDLLGGCFGLGPFGKGQIYNRMCSFCTADGAEQMPPVLVADNGGVLDGKPFFAVDFHWFEHGGSSNPIEAACREGICLCYTGSHLLSGTQCRKQY